MKNAPSPLVLAASIQVEIVSQIRSLIDLCVGFLRTALHHAKSFLASLDIRRFWYLLPIGKYNSIVYSLRRNVRPSGVTVEVKFKYLGIF